MAVEPSFERAPYQQQERWAKPCGEALPEQGSSHISRLIIAPRAIIARNRERDLVSGKD